MSRMLSKMNLISVVQQLPKEGIETIQGYVEMIEEENQELEKQLEERTKMYQNAYDYSQKMEGKAIILETQQKELKKQLEQYQEEVCILDMRTDENIKLINQQKKFIKYLEDEIKSYKNRDKYMVTDIHGNYDLKNIKLELLEETLKKYKEIIGVSDDKK